MIQRVEKVEAPSFRIRDIPIYGDLILAPMDGVTDLPMRALARELGSAMSYTGFINCQGVVQGDQHLEPVMAYEEDERPVVFQIFDDDPDRILRAALILRERNPDIIDVNMGCSAKTVAGRGAGAGLLVEPKKIARIFQLLSKNLDIPVTGKIRLGWDDESLNYIENARIIEDNGGQLVAVHGRTKKQGYTGRADWDAIAEVKQALHIPVIGNGDVTCVEEIEAMKTRTGVDGVMIGRAALGNPWLFQRLDREQVSREVVYETMLRHLERSIIFYGEDRGLILFRKFATRYISPYVVVPDIKKELLICEVKSEFISLLKQILFNGVV